MKPRLFLTVHGFADYNGKLTLDTYAPFFREAGYQVLDFDYGFRLLLTVWLRNDHWAQKLAEKVNELSGDYEVVGIGHSNGCAILQKALKLGAWFEQMVWLCPALNSSPDIGENVDRVHVLYSRYDVPVRIAGLIPRHIWGEMGATGYTGRDQRVINYNRHEDFEKKSVTHLDLFLPAQREFWARTIIDLVEGN